MLADAYADKGNWIKLIYRTDGAVLTKGGSQPKPKREKPTLQISSLLMTAFNVRSEADMQERLNKFARVCGNFDCTFSTKKAEIML